MRSGLPRKAAPFDYAGDSAHRLRSGCSGVILRAGRSQRILNTLVGIALALAVFALGISPYLIALRVRTGQWQLVEEAGSTYVSAAGLASSDVAAFDRATWGLDAASGQVYLFAPASESQGLLPAIAADPHGFIRRVRSNLGDLLATTFSSQIIPLALAALALLGLFARSWDTRRLRGELLLIASLAGPLSFLPFFIQTRYLAGALIPALVWIGAGTAWLGEWLIRSWILLRADTHAGRDATGNESCHVPGTSQVPGTFGAIFRAGEQRSGGAGERAGVLPLLLLLRGLPALLLALALFLQQPGLRTKLQQTNSFQPGHLAASAELRAAGASADAVVMSRYPAIAFHAGTRWAPTPAATWPEVKAYALRHGVDYLVVDAWEIKLRPQLSALLEPVTAPAELEHLATVDRGAGPVVVYRLRP